MLTTYYLLFTILVLAAFLGVFYYCFKSIFKQVIVFIGIWLAYLTVLSQTGILKTFELPPRFPLLVMLPIFIVVLWFLHKNRTLWKQVPVCVPVYFQSFRIGVELLLHATFLKGFIPIQTTYSGWNFEIYFAATAIAVGFLAQKGASPLLVKIWNLAGLGFLLTILTIFMTSAFFPSVWGTVESQVSKQIGELPFLIVPGLYVPMAIFMHGLSLYGLKKN